MKQRRTKRVTLADVAARAGVSVATASVAITGRPSGNCRVSPAVATKIRAAAAELKYRPNVYARNLSTRRTRTIALMVKRVAWHNAMFYMAAFQRDLRAQGYTEMLMLQPDNTLEGERANLDLCVERQVEGIITIPLIDLERNTNLESYQRVQREEGIPIVQLGLALPGLQAPSVVTDEVAGFNQIVRLLHAMGHQRIAHLTIFGHDDPSPFNPYTVSHQRYLGYRKAMAELGLKEQVFAPQHPGGGAGDALFDNALVLAAQIASTTPRPTAVVCFSDYSAAGLITGLRPAGVRVPDDMSLIGVGDQFFGRMLEPKLTVLSPAFDQQAQLATSMLLKMIEGATVESKKVMPTLLMRESVREVRG